MIGRRDLALETQLAILTLTRDAVSCHHCGDKPGHRYEPGCRFLGCERSACKPVVEDCTLADGFQKWNRAASLEASAARAKGKGR
jgi:hypothetical protein